VGRPTYPFPNICRFFQFNSNQSKLVNYKKGTLKVLKISKLCRVEDKYKGNNFPFEKMFKFLTYFELKIQEVKQS
jgi:hypothetical protein